MRWVVVRRIVVGVVLTAACALCFGRLVIHPTDTLVGPQRGGANDLTEYFQPLRVYQLETWRRYGQLPAWDFNLQLGRPMIGNPQTSLYYPPNWLYFLVGTEHIASWLMVLHHLLAGWGMYLLCRRYKLAWQAALLGGVAYLAAPYFVAHTAEGHYPQICVAAWIPWALLCFERLRLGKRLSVPLMAGVLALAFFCGHAQEVYYLVLVLTGFWVVDLIRQPPGVLPRGDFTVRWIGVGLLTAGIVAIDFLPIWMTAKQTTRGQAALSAVAVGGASWQNLQQLACPLALGKPEKMLQQNQYYWETLISFGAAPLVLACLGIILGWRAYPTRRYAVLLLVAIVFALGSTTPLYTVLHIFVPGMSTFRLPSRIMFIASAAAAVLAAVGLHHLLIRLRRSEFAARLAPMTALIAIALVIAELSGYGIVVTRTIAAGELRERSQLTARLADSAASYRVLIDQSLLSDEEAWRHNIARVRGYDPFQLEALPTMLMAMIGNRDYFVEEVPGYNTQPQLRYANGPLALFGARYAAVPNQDTIDSPTWSLVERGQMPPRVRLRGASHNFDEVTAYSLYENKDILPRAFVLGHTEKPVDGIRVIGQLSRMNPREKLLIEEDRLPAGERQDFAPATIVEYTPSRVVVDAELDFPGYLILTDMYAAGWTATVDGQAANIVPVNIGFRGVPLSAGKRRVKFTFTPPLWRFGALASCLSLLVCVLLVVGSIRTRVEPRRHGGIANHQGQMTKDQSWKPLT